MRVRVRAGACAVGTVTAVALLAGLGGCGGGGTGVSTTPTGASTTPSTTAPTSGAASTPTATGASGPASPSGPASGSASGPASAAGAPTARTAAAGAVTFAFGGDVHFQPPISTRLASGGPAALLPEVSPALSGADVAMVNLETAITDRGTAAVKQFTFRGPPAGLTALKDAGVDVVTVANNHGEDYGPLGLQDTLAAGTAQGLPMVGIGENAAAAFAPWTTTVRGVKVSVIGATQVMDSNVATAWTATDTQAGLAVAKDPTRLIAAVTAARATSDIVVVYLHWGVEGSTCPTAAQETLAGQLKDAGADVIVGSHAHRVIGGGRLGADGPFVDYGLGNFVFYAQGGAGATTGVLTLTVDKRVVTAYQWHPGTISAGTPRLSAGAAATSGVAAWNALRGCTNLVP
jgi:hypothetical protein